MPSNQIISAGVYRHLRATLGLLGEYVIKHYWHNCTVKQHSEESEVFILCTNREAERERERDTRHG